jgi:hypothetical protein
MRYYYYHDYIFVVWYEDDEENVFLDKVGIFLTVALSQYKMVSVAKNREPPAPTPALPQNLSLPGVLFIGRNLSANHSFITIFYETSGCY